MRSGLVNSIEWACPVRLPQLSPTCGAAAGGPAIEVPIYANMELELAWALCDIPMGVTALVFFAAIELELHGTGVTPEIINYFTSNLKKAREK